MHWTLRYTLEKYLPNILLHQTIQNDCNIQFICDPAYLEVKRRSFLLLILSNKKIILLLFSLIG